VKWTRGVVPLGYDAAPEGGRRVVNKDEAGTAETIFQLYLEQGSLLAVVRELRRRGVRRKTWTTRDGKIRGGRSFNNVDVHPLLTDVRYAGAQVLGDETFKREHAAIISNALFDRVQRVLDQNRRSGGSAHRNRHGALLRGILRCAACDSEMTHTFTKHRKLSFRYYRCSYSIKNGAGACSTGSVAAQRIEEFVVEQIKKIGSVPALRDETFRQAQAQIATVGSELARVTNALSRATGPAADALLAKLAEMFRSEPTRWSAASERSLTAWSRSMPRTWTPGRGKGAHAVHRSMGRAARTRAGTRRPIAHRASSLRRRHRDVATRVLPDRLLAARRGSGIR
jgi:hypothetical protein